MYLEDEFCQFGTIVSTKVLRYRKRNVGFVCFSTPKEAQKAIYRMNGSVVMGRKMVVELCQPKEEIQRMHQHKSIIKY